MPGKDATTIWISAIALALSFASFALSLRKWFYEGVRLQLRVIENARRTGSDDELVSATLTNLGTVATTITHLTFQDYSSWWRMVRRRPDWAVFVPETSPVPGVYSLPYTLKPGEQWMGLAARNGELKTRMATGRLHMEVVTAHKIARHRMRKPQPLPPSQK